MREVYVVKATDADILRRQWRGVDPTGYQAAGADPFAALRLRGLGYGHTANPVLGGYHYRAWVRPMGSSKPLQAQGGSLLEIMLGLLIRVISSHERVLS